MDMASPRQTPFEALGLVDGGVPTCYDTPAKGTTRSVPAAGVTNPRVRRGDCRAPSRRRFYPAAVIHISDRPVRRPEQRKIASAPAQRRRSLPASPGRSSAARRFRQPVARDGPSAARAICRPAHPDDRAPPGVDAFVMATCCAASSVKVPARRRDAETRFAHPASTARNSIPAWSAVSDGGAARRARPR